MPSSASLELSPAETSDAEGLAERVRLALDCLPDPTLVVDGAERVLYSNAAYATLTGRDPEETLGQPLAALMEPDGSNADPASVVCRSRGGFVPMRAAIRPMAGRLGGELRMVRLEEGQPRGTFVERLSAGLELKGELLARISHELRTPLTAVQEGLDVVLDGLTGPLNERQREFLGLARRNVQRLNRLVTDTLELDSLKRGESGGPRKCIDLVALVEDCARAYERVQVERGTAARVWVEADSGRIGDVVDKLIQNAIRHSHAAAVCVRVLARNLDALVEVSDAGPGIPADKLDEIFEEFEQLSIGPGRTVGGVGLGLTIAKLVVEQHGGRIWAESEPGRGSRFYFSLKLCSAPSE